MEQAQAEIDSLMAGIMRAFPGDYESGARAVLTPLRVRLFGRAATALWCVWGAVGFVLLIGCANVANLVLARAMGRAKELALRTALGASRARLVRQLLIESLLLGGCGAVAGVLLAYAGTGVLASLLPDHFPRADQVHVDGGVLLFGLAAGLLTGLLFGVAPAWHMSRVDPDPAIRDPGNHGGNRRQNRLRAALIVAEVALAFVLALGAGVMAKSFIRLTSVDPGYDPHKVLTLTTNLWSRRYWETPAAGLHYYRDALDRIRAIPGIEGAAFTSLLPMDYTDRGPVEVQDPAANGAEAPVAANYSVSPDYFRVLRIPVKRGRVFTDQDTATTPPVAVINESFARARFPQEDPIGKKVKLAWGPWMTVVGMVGDVRQSGLDQAPEQGVYAAQTQGLSLGYYRLVARTRVDPMRLEHDVRDAFLSVDKLQPVYHVKPLDRYLAGTLADRTFATGLLALFGALAVALAAVGIYGIASYSVSLRTREIGIRMALGAQHSEVLTGVLRDVLVLVVRGIAIGYGASVVVVRLLEKLLFEVRPTDIATTAAVAVVLGGTALVAGGFPARRAASIDPVVALRDE